MTNAQQCAAPTASDFANPEGEYNLTTNCDQTFDPQSGGTYEIAVDDNRTYTFTICPLPGETIVPYAELWAGDGTFITASVDEDGCAEVTYVNCDGATEVYLNVYSTHGTDMCEGDWVSWEMTTSCTTSVFECPSAIKLSITDATSCCFEGQLPVIDFSNLTCGVDSYTLEGTDCDGMPFTFTDPMGPVDAMLPIGINFVTHTVTIDGEEFICTQQVTITKAIACTQSVQISLDQSCQATVTPATFTNFSCPDDGAYTVGLTVNGVSVQSLNQSNIGANIIAVVTDPHGNSCNSQIILEDKLGPKIACPDDITLPCGADFSIEALGDAVVSDCTDVGSTTVTEVGPTGDPCSAGGETVVRTWTSVDVLGNTSTCSQVITFVRPDLVTDLTCPPNFIDVDDDDDTTDGELMLSCDSFPISSPPGIEVTGGFTLIMGGDTITLQEGLFCNFLISKTDEIVPTCGGSYDILRVWKIRDWCDVENERICSQVIKVRDTTAPTGTPGSFTFTAAAQNCVATVNVTPASFQDGCSSLDESTFTTSLVQVTATGTGSTITVPGNGGVLTNIPLGTYNLVYNVADECNNTGEVSLDSIVLIDNLAPIAVCDNKTVALGTNGEVLVCASVIDDGSFDNCQVVATKIKRMDAPADGLFTDCVALTCEDAVEGAINIRFRVYDTTGMLTPNDDLPEVMGRWSECMSTITVQDKLRPTCGSLPDVVVACAEDFMSHPDFASGPNAFDNCSFDFTMLPPLGGPPSSCGDDLIIRQWQLSDPSDPSWVGPICQQRVVINATPFDVDPIWPADVTVDCSTAGGTDANSLPDGSNFPVFPTPSDDICEDLVIASDDKILENQPGACFIIIRTWKIFDVCQNPGFNTTGPGYWSFNQKITVTDSQGPTFTTTPGDKFVDLGANCQATFFLDPAAASDVCSEDITITRSVPPSFILNGNGSYTASAGVHNVTYTALDGCGNQTDLTITITIQDNQPPTPVCLGVFATTLVPDGNGCRGELWASDLHNNSSSDNCPGELQYFVTRYFIPNGNGGQIVNTTVPTTTNISFDENDLGSNLVQLWVVDASGNADFCVSEIIIQDNLGVCIPCNAPSFSVAQDPVSCSASVVGLSGGVPPYGFQWAPMAVSDPNFTFTSCENNTTCGLLIDGASYQVTVTDAVGCSSVSQFIMDCNTGTGPCDAPTFSVAQDPVNCSASVVGLSGGVAPYGFQWAPMAVSDPDFTFSICENSTTCGGLIDGAVYQVTVTDAVGCETVNLFTMSCNTGADPCEGLNFNVVIVNSNPLCNENAFAEVTFISPGSVTEYSYTWMDAFGNIIPGCGNGANCSVLPAGTSDYVVRATNANGCSTEKPFSIDCTGMISGRIQNEEGASVQNVDIDATGMTPLTTDINGEFMFEDLTPGGNYTITPEKDVDFINGVSTFDLVLISQHILGVQALGSPYKIIAADANNSGSVTTLDLVELRSLILQIYDEFPNNTSWRFVDKDFVFPNVENPFATTFPEVISYNSFDPNEELTDFVAVKIGDVNCSATTGNLTGALNRSFDGDLVLNVDDQKFGAGEVVDVTFKASEFEEMLGYQFTLEFDTDKLAFNDFAANKLQNCTADNFGYSMLDQGVITASWNTTSGVTLKKNTELFTLSFTAKASGNLSDYLTISSKETTAEAYKASAGSAELMDVVIGYNNGNTTTVLEGAYELYQNQPNPFNAETKVGFNLPQAGNATITVFDVSGKVIKQVNQEFARGYNQVIFNKSELNATGVLYYQLQTSEFTDTRKMLLID